MASVPRLTPNVTEAANSLAHLPSHLTAPQSRDHTLCESVRVSGWSFPGATKHFGCFPSPVQNIGKLLGHGGGWGFPDSARQCSKKCKQIPRLKSKAEDMFWSHRKSQTVISTLSGNPVSTAYKMFPESTLTASLVYLPRRSHHPSICLSPLETSSNLCLAVSIIL